MATLSVKRLFQCFDGILKSPGDHASLQNEQILTVVATTTPFDSFLRTYLTLLGIQVVRSREYRCVKINLKPDTSKTNPDLKYY